MKHKNRRTPEGFRATTYKNKSGKWKITAEVRFFNESTGRWMPKTKRFNSQTAADDWISKTVNKLKVTDGRIVAGEKMTFDQLADLCKEKFYRPAVIVEGRKIEGSKSHKTFAGHIARLKEYFGKRKIGDIKTDCLKQYRLWRLKKGSRRLTAARSKEFVPVKLSTVNRELAVMRKMMRFAFSEDWILRDIFFNAKVIDASAEIERKRILTESEETALLAACQSERRITYKRKHYGKERQVTASIARENPYLKAIILLAVDTGMRRGEILKLRWRDIDLENNVINILGTNTKTERARIAPLTERVKAELARVREFTPGDKPFPFSSFKRSWATAKRLSGIDDLHFHDLRRTAITRWQKAGLPLALAGKFAGHTNLQTTQKHYTATDIETTTAFAETLNKLQEAKLTTPLQSAMVN